jgi:hypothetical protein
MTRQIFILLAVVGVSLARSYIQPPRFGYVFGRSCRYDGDCTFESRESRGSVFLPCEGGKCQCKEPVNKPMDVAFYGVSADANGCNVEGSAPCGTSNGITLSCASGRSCTKGRCRSPSEIGKTPENHSCNDDIDCKSGLKCVARQGGFPISLHCKPAARG